MVGAQHLGSKRKIKVAEREARRVAAVKKRLGRIYELARLITSEQELDTYLLAIPDETVRAETRALIEPFLLFALQPVGVVAPEKATLRPLTPFTPMRMADHPLRLVGDGPHLARDLPSLARVLGES
jgi:hypothetical protein